MTQDPWTIQAVLDRIATDAILEETLFDDGESAYNAARAEYQKMPIENLLPILDTEATIEAFISECHTFCHLRAVAVVREIHANLHKGINALN